MKRPAIAAGLLLVLALSGCAASLSGVGGAEAYACKAPQGAICTSVSGVHANARHGMTAAKTAVAAAASTETPARHGAASITPGSSTTAAGAAIRSAARILRLWVAPWEDSDGDLHEGALVHVIVDTGRWLIEHVRPAGRTRIDGATPPVTTTRDTQPAARETPPSPSSLPSPGAATGVAPGTTGR